MKKTEFRKFYDSLPRAQRVVAPKTEFIAKISELCRVHPTTVRCWLAGTQKPDALKISLISKELNIPEDQLFI